MTTDTNQPENNDVQVSVVEQLHDLDTSATSGEEGVAAAMEEQVAQTHTQSPGDFQAEQQEGDAPALNGDNQDLNQDTTATDTDDSADAALTAGFSDPAPITPATQILAEEMLTFAYPDEGALRNEDIVRPFTDFIEEFRQTEVGFGSLPHEQSPEQSSEPFASTEEHVAAAPAPQEDPQVTPEAQKPATHKERPVSPLLRPATRGRGPRHSGGRHREEHAASAPAANESTAEAKTDSSSAQPGRESEAAPLSQTAASTEPVMTGETSAASTLQTEPAPAEVSTEEQPKPARRYRFDRPVSASPVAPAQPAQQVRSEEGKENRVTTSTPTHADSGPQVEHDVQPAQSATKQNGGTTHYNGGQQTPKAAPVQEPASTNGGGTAAAMPSSTATHDRRRHSQERQHEKEKGQTAAPPAAAADTTPVAEVTEAAGHTQGAPLQEVPPEDLPPLEYSELQAATSRRRRRRRPTSAGSTTPPATSNAAPSAKPAVPEQPSTGVTTPSTPAPVAASPVALSRNVAVPGTPASASQYNIISGYTVSQMNQGSDGTGPFMGPEPSPARGSNTLREPRIRSEAQRSSSYAARHGEPIASPVSINQLANVISQSFQSQTDRMIAELRRANQVPTNVSVSFPPFPSTERVGVFVDVANLLYSARTQRLTIDFGKLLDFLRGNRRLVRAHAYCPTSPQPGDEQMFLQAVKGLGYRITTKNYKTFSSGAKKADLDLDLCMDVVRLVDGRAVDCVVLVSGDSDFMPMLDYCSDHGVRVEVAAFDESMSATLRQSCDLFINLSMLDEIRA